MIIEVKVASNDEHLAEKVRQEIPFTPRRFSQVLRIADSSEGYLFILKQFKEVTLYILFSAFLSKKSSV